MHLAFLGFCLVISASCLTQTKAFATANTTVNNLSEVSAQSRNLTSVVDYLYRNLNLKQWIGNDKKKDVSSQNGVKEKLDYLIELMKELIGIAKKPIRSQNCINEGSNQLTQGSTYNSHYLSQHTNIQKPKLVCYFTGWDQWKRPPYKFLVPSVDPFLCTHIIYAFSKIGYDGRMTIYEHNAHEQYRELIALKNTNPDLKVMLAIGGWTHRAESFSKMAEGNERRHIFVADVVRQILEFGFDGFDIDWEYPGIEERGGRPIDKENLVRLVKHLRKAFDATGKKLILTVAVSAGADKIEAGYNISELDKYLDFMNLLAYDFHGGWENVTGINAPFNSTKDNLSLSWAIDYWITQGVDPSKLVAGLATYGRAFTLAKPLPNLISDTKSLVGIPVSDKGREGKFTLEAGVLAYYEICEHLQKDGWNKYWITTEETPVAYKDKQWVGYDDVASLKIKIDYIQKRCLGGLMVWDLALDDHTGINCGAGKYPLIGYMKSRLPDFENCGYSSPPTLPPTTVKPIPEIQTTLPPFTCPTMPAILNTQPTAVTPETTPPGTFPATTLKGATTSIPSTASLKTYNPSVPPGFISTTTVAPSPTKQTTAKQTTTKRKTTKHTTTKQTTTQRTTTKTTTKQTTTKTSTTRQIEILPKTTPNAKNISDLEVFCRKGWADKAFECPAEGTFRDKYNCGNYFECIFNPLTGEYMQFYRSCADPVQTIFDPVTKICVWREPNPFRFYDPKSLLNFANEFNEDECPCDIYNIITAPTTTSPLSGVTSSITGTTAGLPTITGEVIEILTNNFTALVGPEKAKDKDILALKDECLNASRKTFHCTQPGMFADNSDCRFYYECVPGMGGLFTIYHRPCSNAGTSHVLQPPKGQGIVIFDPIMQACVWSWQSSLFSLDTVNTSQSCPCNKILVTKEEILPGLIPFLPKPVILDPKEPLITLEEILPVPPKGSKSLMCYFPSWFQWKMDPYRFTPKDIDPFLCTHIVYAFLSISDKNFSVVNIEHNTEEQFEQLTALKKVNPKLKIIAGVGGWVFGAKIFSDLAMTEKSRQRFAKNVLAYLELRNLDGIDLDWEYPGHGGQGGRLVDDKNNFPLLVKEMRKVFDAQEWHLGKRLIITAAVSAGEENIVNGYDIPKLSKYLDLIGIMTYDMNGPWSNAAGHNSPLYNKKSDFSLSFALAYWHKMGTPLNKLLIGIPTYGRLLKLRNPEAHKPGDAILGAGPHGKYTGESGTHSFYEVCEKLQNSSLGWAKKFDEIAKVPFAHKDNIWMSYEDTLSVTYKVKYALKKGYAGAIVWDLAQDDFVGSACGTDKFPIIKTASKLLNIYETSTENKSKFKDEDEDDMINIFDKANVKDISKLINATSINIAVKGNDSTALEADEKVMKTLIVLKEILESRNLKNNSTVLRLIRQNLKNLSLSSLSVLSLIVNDLVDDKSQNVVVAAAAHIPTNKMDNAVQTLNVTYGDNMLSIDTFEYDTRNRIQNGLSDNVIKSAENHMGHGQAPKIIKSLSEREIGLDDTKNTKNVIVIKGNGLLSSDVDRGSSVNIDMEEAIRRGGIVILPLNTHSTAHNKVKLNLTRVLDIQFRPGQLASLIAALRPSVSLGDGKLLESSPEVIVIKEDVMYVRLEDPIPSDLIDDVGADEDTSQVVGKGNETIPEAKELKISDHTTMTPSTNAFANQQADSIPIDSPHFQLTRIVYGRIRKTTDSNSSNSSSSSNTIQVSDHADAKNLDDIDSVNATDNLLSMYYAYVSSNPNHTNSHLNISTPFVGRSYLVFNISSLTHLKQMVPRGNETLDSKLVVFRPVFVEEKDPEASAESGDKVAGTIIKKVLKLDQDFILQTAKNLNP